MDTAKVFLISRWSYYWVVFIARLNCDIQKKQLNIAHCNAELLKTNVYRIIYSGNNYAKILIASILDRAIIVNAPVYTSRTPFLSAMHAMYLDRLVKLNIICVMKFVVVALKQKRNALAVVKNLAKVNKHNLT